MVEEELERIVGAYFDALEARDDAGPIHTTRIQAADRLLDRVYGKPKQAVDIEHSGRIGLEALLGERPLGASFGELEAFADDAKAYGGNDDE